MNLSDYRETFYSHSKSASDISRQLGFAGIAIIWLFRETSGAEMAVPGDLIFPGLLMVLSLTADFLHYIVSAILWSGYTYYKEKKLTDKNADFTVPECINWPAGFFWYAKVALMLAAYILLISFFVKRYIT